MSPITKKGVRTVIWSGHYQRRSGHNFRALEIFFLFFYTEVLNNEILFEFNLKI